MSDPIQPLGLPDQTLAQEPRAPEPRSVPETPSPMETAALVASVPAGDLNATMTLAAPANYDPVAVAQHTKHSGADYKPADGISHAQRTAGRFAVIRSHAKGGMGQVSVATDTELNREIALKEIQPKFRLDEATLHRFILEARVTGKLEHPGIVPVYGMGNYPDGRPYYAMRFVSGQSFQEAIDEFHAKETPDRDPTERATSLRNLLRRFIDVCNTIGFAHSKGYLHRDIKPANVMLGGYGETLVVDWGLAKEMGVVSVAPIAVMPNQEVQDEDFGETREGFTMYGQTMGTPAFMSPEQAAGKWDITGVASDVYSLGAMLYSVLSGTAPYHGTSMEVITRVQKGDYKPVKLVKGNTPAPLDAIVRKAMALEIKDRYPNAVSLAADVECWLADEPVSCYAEPFLVRATRWAKRNRTKVIAAGVVLVTGTIALAVGLVAVNAQKKKTEIAKQDAVESRGEAREALLALTDEAVSEILAGSNRVTPEQAKFLDGLIGMYRKFASRAPDSPETKLFIARSWYQVGRLEARVERYPQASEAYALSADMLATPDLLNRDDAKKTQGEVELYRGILDLQQRKPEAIRDLEAAIATFSELNRKDPKPEYRARLSQAHDRLGVYYMTPEGNNPKLAEEHWNAALGIRLALNEEFPNDAEYQFRLAQSYRQMASILFAKGRSVEGREMAMKAKTIQEALVQTHKTSVPYLALLADVETVLMANTVTPPPLRPKNGPMPKPLNGPSLGFAQAAAKTWGKLASQNPGDSKFRLRQVEANINLAQQCSDNFRPREANVALEVAFDVLSELQKDDPSNPIVEAQLLAAKLVQMKVLRFNSEKQALPVANETVAFADKLPMNTADNRNFAAGAHLERAWIRMDDNDVKGAKADLDEVWKIVQANPNRENVRGYATAMADWMFEANDFDEVVTVGKAIAALPLPKGESQFIAACFHGRVSKLFPNSPKAEEPDYKEFALNRVKTAILFLRLSVEAGYKNSDALMNDPDLQEPRRTNEFKELVEQLTGPK
ncbi:hypothetical protein BH11PLA2_BH11PLA2_33770 [soil metagenome]